jgi:DMSO/TMAO reductase YedYZ molybdopterin-dependent catalytic subunit
MLNRSNKETARDAGEPTSGLSRRHFIIAGAGAGVLVSNPELGLGFNTVAQAQDQALPDFASWKDAKSMIVHSKSGLETRRESFGAGSIMPTDRLFVRNNLPSPGAEIVANRDAWEVSIEGVKKPGTKKLGDLKKLGITSVAMVLQCSGNGRGFFTHKASGSKWQVGAAGNVLWTGVPLRAVATAMGGVAGGAKFITGTGAEKIPAGLDPKKVIVERSVPISNLDTAILAWELNGEPVPLAHGGPLRLVVPGYYGVNNIKYIKKLAFTQKETDANIQTSGYRMRPVGQKGAPVQPSMWEMTVKSWVTNPLKETDKGPVQIYGVAFAGVNPVKRVDVSIDGGKTWKQAKFIGPDLGKYAWRTFVLSADLKPGTHIIASRATDTKGNTQPEKFVENERGYGHNGWAAHAVKVTVA